MCGAHCWESGIIGLGQDANLSEKLIKQPHESNQKRKRRCFHPNGLNSASPQQRYSWAPQIPACSSVLPAYHEVKNCCPGPNKFISQLHFHMFASKGPSRKKKYSCFSPKPIQDILHLQQWQKKLTLNAVYCSFIVEFDPPLFSW